MATHEHLKATCPECGREQRLQAYPPVKDQQLPGVAWPCECGELLQGFEPTQP